PTAPGRAPSLIDFLGAAQLPLRHSGEDAPVADERMPTMTFRSNRLLVAAAALAVAAAGAGAGAGVYAALGTAKTKTVINSVTTVDRTQQFAASRGLTVTEIYQRAFKGAVDITVGGSSGFSFGGGGATTGEGSGFV